MADTDVSITISGDSSGAEKALKAVGDAAESAMKRVTDTLSSPTAAANALRGSFEQLSKPLEQLRSGLAAVSAVLAGGGLFGKSIDATKDWAAEQGALARQLGITTAKAAAYQVATREIGADGSILISAADRLTRQLGQNGEAFEKLGIRTKNADGSLRSMGELLPDVIDSLRNVHGVTEQNSQGIALFGRGWGEVRGILKLSGEALREAADRARELNLVVEPEAVKKYKAAMADVKLVTTSLEVQIGTALMPTLTKMGRFMSGEGKDASEAFQGSLQGVSRACLEIYFATTYAMRAAGAFAAVIGAVTSGNLRGAVDVFQGAGDELDALGKRWDKAREDFAKPLPMAKADDTPNDPHVDLTKDTKDPSRLAKWEAELAELKLHKQEEALTQGKFYEMSKADEKTYWDAKLALTKSGTNENLAVRKKDAELGLAIQKDAFEVQLQDLKAQSDAFRNNLQAKIALAEQEAKIIGEKYGLESKEYKAVQGDILKLKREVVAQEVELESAKQESMRRIRYSEIDLDQEIANERLALGLITETEMLQLERKFEDQRTQIAVSAQRARIAAMEGDPDHSPIALQKEKDELLQIEQQHALAVRKINGKIAVDALTDYRSMVSSIGGAFTSMFTSIATGQAKVGAAIKTMFTSVLQSAVEMIAQYLAKKAAAFAVETAMNSGFLSTKAAAELAALIAGNAAKSTAAAGEITASAGVAAAGGAAAMASIPYVGPILAAGAYADMMALGLSALPMASAAGGWDIPGNLNPIVQAHAGEMILPAAIAKRFRSAAPGDGEDGSGGGRGDVHHHYNVTVNGPQDKRSMERWMADLLPGATNRSQRSFGMSK